MLRSAANWTGGHSLIRARVSEMTDAGETDILMVVDLEGADRLAVMFEDKIGAVFQPVQADRYRQRGREGIRDGRWDRFMICLCAPESYIAAARPANEWDAYLALESIIEWAEGNGDSRYAFVAAICSQATSKRNARISEVSLEATAFWQAYRQLANELLPEVDITRLATTVSRASPWPRFAAMTLPSNLLLEHKPQQGCVDLTFDKCALDDLKGRLPAGLAFDIQAVRVGGSSALRIPVPRVDHLQSFVSQKDTLIAICAAINRLLALGREMSAPTRVG